MSVAAQRDCVADSCQHSQQPYLHLPHHAAVPAVFSLLVLVRAERGKSEAATRRHLVAFSVDQQTTLVLSGDKARRGKCGARRAPAAACRLLPPPVLNSSRPLHHLAQPTITPAMLSEYVSFLLDSGDTDAGAIADKCRSVRHCGIGMAGGSTASRAALSLHTTSQLCWCC